MQSATANRPSHRAHWSSKLFEDGMGQVLLARLKGGGGRVELGIFLLDLYCLGVKNAMFDICSMQAYEERFREYFDAGQEMVEVDPSRARDLVEQSIQYAKSLGFAPHPDCKKASRVFGGVRLPDSREAFVFGSNGKPLYIRGPNESMAVARRIMGILDSKLGKGNYGYLAEIEGGGEEESGV